MEAVTIRDAEEWHQWLATKGNRREKNRAALGSNTVRRRTGVARQIFATAIRWKLIGENPFRDLVTTVRENKARQELVAWASVEKVLEEASTTEWKALIAFCRLVGPRVASELVELRWSDIDFVNRRIVIRSPKTKHHGGDHALRFSPMCPELVPYLQQLCEHVGVGVHVPFSAPVFPVAGVASVNLRTSLRRFIVKAGLQVWPKLFHNMRSSRETELLAEYSNADVCSWLGHSPQVAARFYAKARLEVLQRASRETTLPRAPAGARDDKNSLPDTEACSKPGAIISQQKVIRSPFGWAKTKKKSRQS